MEHPPKQGLKPNPNKISFANPKGFNGTSTKTRIETKVKACCSSERSNVLMEHPPKQGLKPDSRFLSISASQF